MSKVIFYAVGFFMLVTLFSCVKSRCENEDFKWVYYDPKALNELGYYSLGGHKCEYLIWVDSSCVYVESRCTKRCNILNKMGEVVDIFPFIERKGLPTLQKIDTTKRYVWDKWEYGVELIDTTLISRVEYISSPTESLKLLSGRRPKREHKINYTIKGKERSIILPITSGYNSVHDIRQYDSSLFVMSITASISEIKAHGAKHYVVMIDLEDFSRRRFLGIKF